MNSTALTRQRQGKQSARCNDDDRGLRLKQGGEAGAALRFFKAPPRGCGKIGKRNPSGGALLYKLWLARGWLCRGMSTGLNGDPKEYLKNVAGSHGLED